jgi:MFS transporter, DHA2 family, glioxin efflux transporter
VPRITDEFGGLEDVSWYAAAYFMIGGGTQPSAGKAYKFFNLKYSFLISMLIFEIGSLICGAAPTSKALIFGRAIAGLGASGLVVGAFAIVPMSVPPKKAPLMISVISMTYVLSAVLGPIVGGAFSESVTWRWCFYINRESSAPYLFLIPFFPSRRTKVSLV